MKVAHLLSEAGECSPQGEQSRPAVATRLARTPRKPATRQPRIRSRRTRALQGGLPQAGAAAKAADPSNRIRLQIQEGRASAPPEFFEPSVARKNSGGRRAGEAEGFGLLMPAKSMTSSAKGNWCLAPRAGRFTGVWLRSWATRSGPSHRRAGWETESVRPAGLQFTPLTATGHAASPACRVAQQE